MLELGAFLMQLFGSRLFIAVKMLLKYNHKLFPVNVMFDKYPKNYGCSILKGMGWFGLRFGLGVV